MHVDSAGVTVVLNGRADRALEWTFERILDLGSSDIGPAAFFRVFPTSIGVDSLGNLYVLDAGNFRISVFDREGRWLRSFGREGAGPGELGFPSDMAVSPAGKAAVYDFARRALVRFDPDGTFTGTLPVPGILQRKVAFLDDGSVVAIVSQPSAVADSTDYRLLTLAGDTVEIARVREIRDPRPQQFPCMTMAQPPLLGPRIIWAAAGDRIAVSDDATYSIKVFERDRLAAVWKRDLPVIETTLELAAWAVAEGDSLRFRGPAAGPRVDCAVPAEEAARKFGYADVAPLITDIAVAPDGGVWASAGRRGRANRGSTCSMPAAPTSARCLADRRFRQSSAALTRSSRWRRTIPASRTSSCIGSAGRRRLAGDRRRQPARQPSASRRAITASGGPRRTSSHRRIRIVSEELNLTS